MKLFKATLAILVLAQASVFAVERKVDQQLLSDVARDVFGWSGAEPREVQDDVELPVCDEAFLNLTIPEDKIPAEFDARSHWKECPSLWEIRDQGPCNSCYAVSVASVLTDRYCIHHKGKDNFRFSEQFLLSCTRSQYQKDMTTRPCRRYIQAGRHANLTGRAKEAFAEICLRDSTQNLGCTHGSVERTWDFMSRRGEGVPSGGEFESEAGCLPYQYPGCDHKGKKCGLPITDVPECPELCQDKYGERMEEDKKMIQRACKFVYDKEQHEVFKKLVKREIMERGPIVGILQISEGFFNSKGKDEVYKDDDTATMRTYHAMKVVGWGVVGEEEYWLVSNSYNYYWSRRGFFKMFSGKDRIYSLGINQMMSVGIF